MRLVRRVIRTVAFLEEQVGTSGYLSVTYIGGNSTSVEWESHRHGIFKKSNKVRITKNFPEYNDLVRALCSFGVELEEGWHEGWKEIQHFRILGRDKWKVGELSWRRT